MKLYKKKELGNVGEDITIKYLKDNGYIILERNFYCRQGEIDIIAKQQNEIVFVEVKTRTSSNYGAPIDSVNGEKFKHIFNSANYFLYKNNLLDSYIRFDVVEVLLLNGRFKVNHIKQII